MVYKIGSSKVLVSRLQATDALALWIAPFAVAAQNFRFDQPSGLWEGEEERREGGPSKRTLEKVGFLATSIGSPPAPVPG
jgi:hypothetical protein